MRKGPEQSGVMVFRPGTTEQPTDVTITNPEQLAFSGIYVHPNAIEQTWGTGAFRRYKDARTVADLNTLMRQVVKNASRLIVGEYMPGMVMGFIGGVSRQVNGATVKMADLARTQSLSDRVATAATMLETIVTGEDRTYVATAIRAASDFKEVLEERTKREKRWLEKP